MSRARLLLGLACLLVALTAIAATQVPEPRPSCRVLRNGVVSLLPDPRLQCAWPPLSRPRIVAPSPLRRPGQQLGLAFVSAVAGLGLALPAVWISRRRRSSPGRALALFYTSAGGLVFLATSGVEGAVFEWVELTCLVVATCALAHLGLAFPHDLLARSPGLERLPYAVGAVAFLVAGRALEIDTLLWPAVCGLLVVVAMLWLGSMALASLLLLRESHVPVERARGAAGVAALFLLTIPLLALLPDASDSGRQRLALGLFAWLLVAPGPAAIAVSGYDLFDLRLDARRLGWRLGVGGLAAGVGALGFAAARVLAEAPWSPKTSLGIFLMGLGCAALADTVVNRWAPGRRREAALHARLVDFDHEIVRLRHDHEVAGRLSALLLDVVPSSRVAVYALRDEGPELLSAAGSGSFAPGLAARADGLLAGGSSLRLWQQGPDVRARAAPLLGAGVELVLAIRSDAESLALVLAAVGSPPPTRLELGVAERACSQTGVALSNARLAARWVASERRAATGRAALGLAHDLQKELAWIRRLASRLPARVGEPERFRRDLRAIEDLAQDRAESLRRFVRRATEPGTVLLAPLGEVVQDALKEVTRRLPAAHALCALEDGAAALPVDRRLVGVVADLVDNAVRSCTRGQLVLVHAARLAERLHLAVRDRGRGLDAGSRPFEPGFTTRSEGCGVGLAISREVVGSLGGRLEIARAVGGGTRAWLEVPCEPV